VKRGDLRGSARSASSYGSIAQVCLYGLPTGKKSLGGLPFLEVVFRLYAGGVSPQNMQRSTPEKCGDLW
jgi:hypothetical protein